MIRLEKFIFNPFAENTFVAWDDASKDCAVIDPGNSSPDEDRMLETFIVDNKLNVLYLINTHCHLDHILGCKFVKERFNPGYLIPEKDLPFLENAETQALAFSINISGTPKPDKYISEELKLHLGKHTMNFLFTPGHTPGEYCIYFEEEKICISGDVLFREGIGRTDLWGGSYDTLIESIKTKLFTLPEDVTIYPGHGDKSTIGHEKTHNPFLV